jgi:hypothetical protein
MDVHAELNAYLQRAAPNASYGYSHHWVNVLLGPGWSPETVEALAESFLADAEFRGLRLEPGSTHRMGGSSLQPSNTPCRIRTGSTHNCSSWLSPALPSRRPRMSGTKAET